MANESNNNNPGVFYIAKIAFVSGIAMMAGMSSVEWAIPRARKLISEGVEYLKDIKRKRTEEVLKTDGKSE